MPENHRCFIRLTCLLYLFLYPFTSVEAYTIGHCAFDSERLSFKGSPVEQVRCLLSPVRIGGKITSQTVAVSDILEKRVGQPTNIDKNALREFLTRKNLASLANKIDTAVSQTKGGNSARYFVIHDTSQKFNGSKFPIETDAQLNQLGFKYKNGDWVAHAFVNRKGELLIGYDFEHPWRATQLENKVGLSSRGLFLHIEHNQPRLRDTAVRNDNDRLAPNPGFTSAQYEQSALLYIYASSRAGYWLIPGYHAVIDAGVVEGGHDDPQNWDQSAFEQALARLVNRLELKP